MSCGEGCGGWLWSRGLRTRRIRGAGGARCARGARRAGGARGQLCHKSSQHEIAERSRWTRATRQAHPHRVGSNCRRRGCIAPLRALLGTGIRLQRARPTRLQRLAGIADAVVLPLGGRDRRNGGEHATRTEGARASKGNSKTCPLGRKKSTVRFFPPTHNFGNETPPRCCWAASEPMQPTPLLLSAEEGGRDRMCPRELGLLVSAAGSAPPTSLVFSQKRARLSLTCPVASDRAPHCEGVG